MEHSMSGEQFMSGAKLTLKALVSVMRAVFSVLRVMGKVIAWTFGIIAIMAVFMTRM